MLYIYDLSIPAISFSGHRDLATILPNQAPLCQCKLAAVAKKHFGSLDVRAAVKLHTFSERMDVV